MLAVVVVVLVIDDNSRRSIGLPSCIDMVAWFLQRPFSFRITAASWTVGTCVVNLNSNILRHFLYCHCCLEEGMKGSVRLT